NKRDRGNRYDAVALVTWIYAIERNASVPRKLPRYEANCPEFFGEVRALRVFRCHGAVKKWAVPTHCAAAIVPPARLFTPHSQDQDVLRDPLRSHPWFRSRRISPDVHPAGWEEA